MKKMFLKRKSKKQENNLQVLTQTEEQKKLKKSDFKIPKKRSGVILEEVNFQESYFKTKYGEYFSFMFLGSFNVMASDSEVIEMNVKAHADVYKKITEGLSFIDIYVSQDYNHHIDFLKSKYGENEYLNYVVDEKIHQFNQLSKMTVQLSYAMIFADTIEELKKKRNDFKQLFYVDSSVVTDPYEYAQIIFKINHKNLPIDIFSKTDLMVAGEYNENKFINTVSVKQKPFFVVKDIPYVKNQYGYETCFQIFDFKNKEPNLQWLKGVSSLENVVVVRSHSTQNIADSYKYLDNQSDENSEEVEKGRKTSNKNKAGKAEGHVSAVLEHLDNGGVIVDTVIRIYAWGDTVDELDRIHAEINSKLITYQQTATLEFYVNERNWIAPFQSLKYQKEYGFYAPSVKEIPSNTLGLTLPYDYQMLIDEQGVLIGNSFTGQPIVFNQFKIDEKRNSYHMSLIGNMGKGKSTLMKILEEHAVLRGDYLYGFDFEKERKNMIEKYNGLYPDGSQSALNPLQIYVTDSDENLSANYISHLSRLKGFFKYLYSDLSSSDLLIAQMIVQQAYYNKGITPYVDFRLKKNEEYPIFDDCLSVYQALRDNENEMFINLQEQLKSIENEELKASEVLVQFKSIHNIQNINEDQYENILIVEDYEQYSILNMRVRILREEIGALKQFIDNKENLKNQSGFEKLDLLFKSLSSGGVYSMLFNKHTTFNPSSDNKIIIVDMSKLWNGDLNVLQAVYYTWNNFFWSKIVPLKEQHGISYENLKHVVLSLDEAKILLDAKNTYALEQLSQYSSRGRKYMMGMIFGLQALRDIIPEATDSYFLDTIKRIFSLVQYTFMFQQAGSNLGLLSNVFPHLTQRQLNLIPQLKKGQTLLMVNDESYFINVFASERQKELFTGGY